MSATSGRPGDRTGPAPDRDGIAGDAGSGKDVRPGQSPPAIGDETGPPLYRVGIADDAGADPSVRGEGPVPGTGGPAGAGFMDLALAQARAAGRRGEVPIGCVVVLDGRILAADGNRTIELSDPTAHAEMLAIRAAAREAGSQRLAGADLYVTLEPCPMCAAAISFARIRRLYYGATDPKGGAVDSGVRLFASPTCHHAPEIYSGLAEQDAARLLREFFVQRR